jgi:cell division protein FtsL
MREDALDRVDVLPKAIDNSHVVREVDPRSSRDLWLLLLLAAALVCGLGLYAWPSLEIRQTTLAREQMSKERERLLEENRKLRLEKAALENLHRVETIARRDLGLVTPAPESLVVVEKPRDVPAGSVVASGSEHPSGGRN